MHQRVPFAIENLHKKPLKQSSGQERWDKATSGRWRCQLKLLTPLCVKSAFDQHHRTKSPPVIPGSSLRGMIRNTAEMLGAGCGRYYSGGRELPARLATCNESSTCPVCRTFGFVEGKQTWQSRVRITDAIVMGKWQWELLAADDRRVYAGGEPEVREGWALFVHSDEYLPGGRVPCVDRGAVFEFGAEYQTLDLEEFAVFRLALTLQGGGEHLAHKLGFAKSLGLGSCRVTIINEPPVRDTTRQADLDRETKRLTEMSGFQAMARWLGAE